MKTKILVSLTTTGAKRNFAKEIEEIDAFGVEEIALFPTYIDFNQRQEIYQLLEKSKIKKIPFVHLRLDMKEKEIDYLINRFGTEIFNIHGNNSSHPFKENLDKYKDRIYLENSYCFLTEAELKKYAGICLDVSHLEDFRKNCLKFYKYFKDLLLKYKCGCGHISAIRKIPSINWHRLGFGFSFHYYKKLSEFDYLKLYKDLLPDIMALELENGIKEQMIAKKYIEKLLD